MSYIKSRIYPHYIDDRQREAAWALLRMLVKLKINGFQRAMVMMLKYCDEIDTEIRVSRSPKS